MSLQHRLSPIVSPFETTNTPSNPPLGLRFGSPDTASTTSAGQQTPTRDPSPIDLNDEHGSTQPLPISSLNVQKTVDQILQTLSLKQCEHEILELLTTSAWVDWEGANFMTYTEFGNRQYRYVRPCYRDLYQILNEMWQGEKPDVMDPQHCALITGTPGIGKSIFGEMLCTVISQRTKPTILFYEDKETNGKILIWQKKAFEVDIKQAVEVVKKLHSAGIFSANSHDEDLIEIWSIGDTSIPVLHRHVNRICITSPGEARIGDFSSKLKFWVKKNKAITLVVPPCNWEETCFIRLAHDFKHVCSLETLRERFELWGGVPRSIVLCRGLTPEIADSEFHNLKITEAMRYLGSYDLDHYHQSGKLFHLLPCFKSLTAEEVGKMTLLDRYDRSNARYYWASEALERKAWTTYRNEKEADVVDYVLTLNNDPSARGKAWEEKIHKLIQSSGLRGPLRNLDSDEITDDLFLHSSNTRFFQDLDEIDDSAHYWRPTSKRHPTCDGYLPEKGIMLQMTIGSGHSINMDGLEKILNSGIFTEWENNHPDETLRLIFVVDVSADLEFIKEQTFRYTESINKADRGRSKEKRREFVNSRVTQYVMKIDLEASLKEIRSGAGCKRGRMAGERADGIGSYKKQKHI